MERIKPASLLWFLILLSGAAFSLPCGTHSPNTGTCGNAQAGNALSCGIIDDENCCGSAIGCEWVCQGTDCNCEKEAGYSGTPTYDCHKLDDNPVGCGAMGVSNCDWQPTLGLPGTLIANCVSYGEDCMGTNCCKGLECDAASGKCNQPPTMCTNAPEVFTYSPALPPGGSPGGPVAVTQKLEQGQGVAGSSSGIYQAGWFSDWAVSGIAGVMIAASLIAIAAIIGHGFNLPEVKAFVDSELRQAVVSLLLIGGLLALLGFFDVVAAQLISSMELPVYPQPGEPIYISAAKQYISSTLDMANTYAKEELKEAYKAQKASSFGLQLQFNFWYLLFAGSSIRWNAGMSMRGERASSLYEMTTKMVASLTAQLYFLNVIAFGIAPVFLLVGIVLRTFFFTRKLGGLLLAIAVSLFFVYPLTYAFAWYTLNVTVYGDRMFATEDPDCPAECTIRYPVAFFIGKQTGAIRQFDTMQQVMLTGITKSNWNFGGPDIDSDGEADFPGLVACRSLAKIGIPDATAMPTCLDCPDYCRDTPFPSALPGCDVAKCTDPDLCNPGCKIMRQRTDCEKACQVSTACPDYCRTKVPTESKCYFNDEVFGSQHVTPADLTVSCSGCKGCPTWCMLLRDLGGGAYEQVYKDEDACKAASCQLSACPASCQYITKLGDAADCNTLCTKDGTTCPKECRVRFKNPANQLSAYDTTGLLPAVCEQPQAVKDACAFCTDLCKVVAPLPPATGCAAYPEVGAPPPEKCESCPEYCRFTDYLFIKDYSNTPMTAPSSSGGKPQKCDEAAPSKISCGGNACLGKCKTGDDPLLCRAYKELSGEPAEGCRKCPTQARLILKHTAGGATTSFPPDYAPSYEANCGGADCASACKQERTVPSQSGGSCLDYNPSGGKLQAPGRQEGIFLAADGSQIAGKQAQPGQGGPMLAAGGASMPGERGGIGLASRAGKDELALAMGTAFPSGAPAFQGALFAAAPKPDYVVTAPAAMTVAVGAPFTFTFSTDNIGDASPSSSSTTTVSFLSSTQSLNVVPLAPEGSQQDSIQLTCTQAGTFTITTTADANGQIGESNENNNVATTSVLCTQECQTCPYDCRVAGLPSGVLDPSCAAKCAACPDSCKAAAAAPLICSEYLGNGPGGSCSGGGVCPSYADEASCKAASCSWQASTGKMCYGPGSCNSYGEGPCYEHSADGCIWADESGDPSVPLGYRIDPAYTDASGCKQCPENCRIAGYAGQCGYSEAAGAPRTVDCSPSECAAACRVPPLPVPEPVVPPPTPAPSVDPDCGYYIAGDACHDCPLLCRRLGDKPQVKYCTLAKDYCGLPNAKEGIGCPDNCKLPDAPRVLCESCFDCPLDCTYYPAIRTDCSDVCSDEALAGPVSIGPDDFLKKLPGAEGEPDVKNVGNLMVPGLVLPLFCIVIVVAFIRVFSPVLGGDIEIPGLGRII